MTQYIDGIAEIPQSRCIVSDDYRTITIPAKERTLGCVGDDETRRVWWDAPLENDGISLRGFELSIHYVNAAGHANRYDVATAYVVDNRVLFAWLVQRGAYEAAGLVNVSIKMRTLDGTTVVDEFNSAIAPFSVKDAQSYDAQPQPEQEDYIGAFVAQQSARIDAKIALADEAIADAQDATTAANTAAASATSAAQSANQAATAANSAATNASQAATDATDAAERAEQAAEGVESAIDAATAAATSANSAAATASTAAANADSKATLASTAASTANQAAQAAESATTAANTAAGQATTAAGNATTAAQSATTAAGNADAKAALADTAAANADTATANANTATANANTATTNATNAAQAANNAADVATEAAETITDGYFPHMLAGAAEALMDETDTATFAERVSSHDGVARIESILGNTVVWNQVAPNETYNTQGSKAFAQGTQIVTGHKYLFSANFDVTATGTGNPAISLYCHNGEQSVRQQSLIALDAASGVYKAIFMATVNGVSIGTSSNIAGNTWLYLTLNGTTTDISQIQLFDLTRMFGAGNEPATVAEFEALFPASYYAYDAGSLLNVNMQGVRTVGFNQFDGELMLGNRNGATITPKTGSQNLCCVNPIRVIPGQQYALENVNLNGYLGRYIQFWDAEYNKIGTESNYMVSKTVPHVATAPQNARWATLQYYVTSIAAIPDDPQICFHLVLSGYRNGEYEPYWTQERAIDTAAYFPDGMKSAGSVYDELTATKAVKRVGVVDLGTLNWVVNGHYWACWAGVPGAAKPSSDSVKANMLAEELPAITYNQVASTIGIGLGSARYLLANNGSTENKPSGLLYYELATPVETEITPPLTMTYTVENGGTESIVIPTGEQSAAPIMAIVYGITADGVVDKALSVIAPIEGSIASTNYAVNSYLIHSNQLYRVTSAIATGETITPGSNCVACTVMGEVIRLTA